MKFEVHSSLNDSLITEIEDFIISGQSLLNPLYSSPLWAIRIKKTIRFNYKFLILRENGDIKALQLVFQGYRGYQKIDKLPYLFRAPARLFVKFFYGYHSWFDSIVFMQNEAEANQLKIKKIIYGELSKFHRIQSSPIWDNDIEFFPSKKSSKWATFVIDVGNNSHDEIYSKFNRNAKRPIQDSIKKGFYIKELSQDNTSEYTKWIIENQSETGKSNRISENNFIYDLKIFNKKNYIYKVFIVYSEDTILGSLSIWGFGNYITEKGVYRSKQSKISGYFEQDFLKDWIIKFSIQNHIYFYDLGGYNPNLNITKKEQGIKSFKKKFGGVSLEYTNINS